MERVDCPSWCAEDVAYGTRVQHQLVVGDVRLTRVNADGARRTTCAVRRRSERTLAQVAQLCEDVAAASHFLRRERGAHRLVIKDNFAVQPHLAHHNDDRTADYAAISPSAST